MGCAWAFACFFLKQLLTSQNQESLADSVECIFINLPRDSISVQGEMGGRGGMGGMGGTLVL